MDTSHYETSSSSSRQMLELMHLKENNQQPNPPAVFSSWVARVPTHSKFGVIYHENNYKCAVYGRTNIGGAGSKSGL